MALLSPLWPPTVALIFSCSYIHWFVLVTVTTGPAARGAEAAGAAELRVLRRVAARGAHNGASFLRLRHFPLVTIAAPEPCKLANSSPRGDIPSQRLIVDLFLLPFAAVTHRHPVPHALHRHLDLFAAGSARAAAAEAHMVRSPSNNCLNCFLFGCPASRCCAQIFWTARSSYLLFALLCRMKPQHHAIMLSLRSALPTSHGQIR
jgi:hypothetical protein